MVFIVGHYFDARPRLLKTTPTLCAKLAAHFTLHTVNVLGIMMITTVAGYLAPTSQSVE